MLAASGPVWLRWLSGRRAAGRAEGAVRAVAIRASPAPPTTCNPFAEGLSVSRMIEGARYQKEPRKIVETNEAATAMRIRPL